MAEQLPLKQFVEGSSPPGVTNNQGLMHKIFMHQTLEVLKSHVVRMENESDTKVIID